MGLVIDLRCLQDPNYAERGIGSHARMIISHAPEFTGLLDPQLPDLPADVARLVPKTSPHAYVPGARLLLNPSPFTPNQLFLARLLNDAGVRKAVCVHDFIPFDDQENYLSHPINRLDYFAAMAWLRRYDIFLPNSAPTAARLRALYGNVHSLVTGVALPPWVHGIVPQTPAHILMIGGDDARKNPELLATAHALWGQHLPLIITGDVAPARAARLRALTRLELPGRLSNAAMRALYAKAALVVTPSRAEGFSLPVLEACAAGVPSIASDIPAHRALLPPEFLFPADAAEKLAQLMAAVLARRDAVVAAQAGLWQDYTAERVAARLFAGLLPKPSVMQHVKPRIALLTPLPPTPSGIARYSNAMLPALRKRARISITPAGRVSPHPYISGRHDAVLCVIGNNPLHQDIYEHMLRWGGAAICHDPHLLGLMSRRGTQFVAAIAARELGRPVAADEITAWAQDERQREASFLGDLARASRPLIFHSQASVALVRARFQIDAQHLGFAMQREPITLDRNQARAALNLAADEKLLISLGYLTRAKALDTAEAALERLRSRLKLRVVFVGAAPFDAARAADQSPPGYVPEPIYQAYLAAADAALQLRLGPPGAISGALQDAIGAGLPCVANHGLAEPIQAPSYVRRVDDALNPDEIATALEAVLTTEHNTADECAAYRAAHDMAGYAENLLHLLGF